MTLGGPEQATPAAFQPLGFGNLLERVFKICWHNWKTFAAIVAILVVPATLFLYSSFLTFPWDVLPEIDADSTYAYAVPAAQQDIDPARFIPFGILFVVAIPLVIIGTTAATGAAIHTAERAHAELPVTWKSAVGRGLRRTHSLIWVTLLTAFFATLAFAFVVAPGVFAVAADPDWTSILLVILMVGLAILVLGWIWLCWMLGPAVVMTEAERGMGALRRSYRLVKGKLLWILGIVFTSLVAQWTIGSAFTVPVALMPLDPTSSGFRTLLFTQMVLGMVPSFIYVPLQATVAALIYVDARVRKEGLTLERFREELQGPAS